MAPWGSPPARRRRENTGATSRTTSRRRTIPAVSPTPGTINRGRALGGMGGHVEPPFQRISHLDGLVVDLLDVGVDAVAIPPQRVLRHGLLVLARQVLGDLLLHVGQW